MPALAPVPKVIRVRLVGTDSADVDLGTSFHMQYSGSAPSIAQLQTFSTAVGTAWGTYMAPLTDTGFTLTQVASVDLSSNSSSTAEVGVSHAGTRSGTPLPLNVAFSLNLPTQLRRRGGHWRMALRAGVQADLATPQTWTATFVSAVISAFESFAFTVQGDVWSGGGSLALVGVQYYGPPNKTVTSSTGRVRTVSTPLAVPAVWPQGAATANARLGSARRRLGKSGG